MLRHLLDLVVNKARSLHLNMPELQWAAELLSQPGSYVGQTAIISIFENMNVPVLVLMGTLLACHLVGLGSCQQEERTHWLVSERACACHTRADEVQNLLLPQVPGAKNVNTAEQATAGRLLKQLLCYNNNKCLWAVTGSSMAVFWVQLADPCQRHQYAAAR